MTMGHPPLATLPAVYLSGSQRVRAGLAVHGSSCVLEASRVGHVADDVVRDQLERKGRAVREGAPRAGGRPGVALWGMTDSP